MNEDTKQRRRWLNLAEFVGVAGLIIAGLGLWNSWSDREQAGAEKASVIAQHSRLDLRATVADGRRVTLIDREHELIDVVVAFPSALSVGVKRPATATIDREWFEDSLLKATDGGADAREGRLPVLITASYLDDDTRRSASAIVEIVWRTQGRVIGGRSLRIEAARLRERGGSQGRIDALWKPKA